MCIRDSRGPVRAVPADHRGEDLVDGLRINGFRGDHPVRIAAPAAGVDVAVVGGDGAGHRRVHLVAGHPGGEQGVRGAVPAGAVFAGGGADGDALAAGQGVRVPEADMPFVDVGGGQPGGGAAAVQDGVQGAVGVDRGDGEPVVVLHEVGAPAEPEVPVVLLGDDPVPG